MDEIIIHLEPEEASALYISLAMAFSMHETVIQKFQDSLDLDPKLVNDKEFMDEVALNNRMVSILKPILEDLTEQLKEYHTTILSAQKPRWIG